MRALMGKRSLGVVLTAAAVMGLAACGSSGSSTAGGGSSTTANTSAPSDTSTTVAGTPFSAMGFSTILPTGWSKNGGLNSSSDSTFTTLAQFVHGDVPVAITIGTTSDYVADISSLPAATAHKEKGTNVSASHPVTVAGETGQFVTFDRPTNGSELHYKLIVVDHANHTYVIIYNGTRDAFDAHTSSLQDVLSAWTWTS